MQEKKTRRSNEQRTKQTRSALIASARALFVEKGFTETSTPDIAKAAQVTRGALYHHFEDKTELFRSVILAESETVACEIEESTSTDMTPLEAMMEGANAYFEAMSVSGRPQLLLIEGPAILGHVEMREIDWRTGGEELRQGLRFMLEGKKDDISIAAMADLLSAMFDRAALAIAAGENSGPYKTVMNNLLRNLME
ncbi:MAG: TetR family transcriptional regulator [Sneathiella sp.]|uniref:TetR/AcrR family transcriptional regulator n=1 Tax=Sneathiella sp. TaxID=1964365 RepID=UPI0030015F4B